MPRPRAADRNDARNTAWRASVSGVMATADLDFCYLTTIGRTSGQARTIEIWFGLEGDTVYLLSGGGDSAHWVRNLQANSNVSVKLGRKTYRGTARLIDAKDEDAKARRLLAAKYEGWEPGRRLSSWARNSLTVAVDVRFTAKE